MIHFFNKLTLFLF